jgi:hypothetical protein
MSNPSVNVSVQINKPQVHVNGDVISVVASSSPLAVQAVTVAQQGPAGPAGASGANITVFGEIPGGTINGSNATFSTEFQFVPESVLVFLNGMLLSRIAEYNTSGNNAILLSDSPEVGDVIQVNYNRL